MLTRSIKKFGSLHRHRHIFAASSIDSETYDGSVVYGFVPEVCESKVQMVKSWDLADSATWAFQDIESDPTVSEWKTLQLTPGHENVRRAKPPFSEAETYPPVQRPRRRQPSGAKGARG